MTAIAFRVAAALLATFGLLILSLFCATLARGLVWRRRARIIAARMPEIHEALADHLTGNDDLAPIRALARSHRRLLDDALLRFKGTVAGSALDRLCGLALELGLVHEWMSNRLHSDSIRRRAAYGRLAFVSASEPCRRLVGDVFALAMLDPDPEVRLAAARGATQLEDGEQIVQAFDFALSQSLLVRILLADALRRHALSLCAAAVPEALRSPDSSRVLAALQILVAWERAVPFDDLPRLLDHRDAKIRLEVIKLAHLVPLAGANRAAIVRALADPDATVGTAAALTAGRLRMEEALPSLARLLRVAGADVARCAAAALAEMPPRGWQTLEELSASESPVTAGLARQALDRARGKAGA